MKLYFETVVHRPVDYIRERFTKELFIHLSKGPMPFELKRFDGYQKGNEVHIIIGKKPLSMKWISLITFEETNAVGWSFIDEGKVLPWPLIFWKHHHRVDRISATESLIVDDINYACSSKFLTLFIRPILWQMFVLRPRRYQNFFKD